MRWYEALMSNSLPELAGALLMEKAGELAALKSVAGFDGFVDTIIHVVATRTGPEEFVRMAEMTEFSRRIGEAAGRSANFEFVAQMVKLGGNGPIFALALASLGPRMTYIGNLGRPQVHAAFHRLEQVAEVFSLSEPGYTDAIEFNDGKLMCGKPAGLLGVKWESILEQVTLARLIERCQDAALLSLVNWTMLVHMTEIFESLLLDVAPKLKGPKRWIFFDLADPARRTREDLKRAMHIISRYQQYFRVILGLNLQEAIQVGEVLGVGGAADDPESVVRLAAEIRRAMDIENIVVHPTHFAAAADAEGACHVAGPFTAHPKITTGAGDHFNAGYCLGRMAGADLAVGLQIGVGTSGYYVRNAGSPNVRELADFLRTSCAG